MVERYYEQFKNETGELQNRASHLILGIKESKLMRDDVLAKNTESNKKAKKKRKED